MTSGSESQVDEIDGDWRCKLKAYVGDRSIQMLSHSEQLEIHTRLVAWPDLPKPTDEVQQVVQEFRDQLAKKEEFDKVIYSTHKELIKCIGDMNFVLRNMFLSSGKNTVKEICYKAKEIAQSRLEGIFATLEANLRQNASANNSTSTETQFNPLTALYGATSRLGSYCGLIYYLTESKLPNKEVLAALLGMSCEREHILARVPSTSQGYRPYTNSNPCTYVPYKSLDSILGKSDTDTCIGTTTTKFNQPEDKYRLYFTLEDCLMSLLKMSFHLSEVATMFAAHGNYELPKVILEFLIAIQQGFMLLQLRNGPIRRLYDRLKYDVKDVGNLIYELGFRLEIYTKATDCKNANNGNTAAK